MTPPLTKSNDSCRILKIVYYLLLNVLICECKKPIAETEITSYTHEIIMNNQTVHDNKDRLNLSYLITINCYASHDRGYIVNIMKQEIPDNITEVQININYCILPNKTLVDTLADANVKADLVTVLRLNRVDLNIIPKHFTAGAKLRQIELTEVKHLHQSKEFCEELHDLREIKIERMNLLQLPPSSSLQLEVLVLNRTTMKVWDNCEHLTSLFIFDMDIAQIPKPWPHNCSKLTSLALQTLQPETIPYIEAVFKDVSLNNLKILAITNSSMEKLPLYLIGQARNLIELDLSINQLEIPDTNDTQTIPQFPLLKKLKVMNLAFNGITQSPKTLAKILPMTPSLRELNLTDTDDILGFLWPLYYKDALALSNLQNLERLYMDGIFLHERNFMGLRFDKLRFLSWRCGWNNTQGLLRLDYLPSTRQQELTVDLRGTSIDHLDLGGAGYSMLVPGLPPETYFVEDFEIHNLTDLWLTSKGYKLTVLLNAVNCDCSNDILHRALKLFPDHLSMPDLKCSNNGRLFAKEPFENLYCWKAHVDGCLRRITKYRNYTTLVDCSNNADNFRWPRPHGLLGLNASKNEIRSLKNEFLPDSLEWMDLRNNNISRVDAEDTARLFARDRRLWLGNNSIVCDCANHAFLHTMRRYKYMVQDYDTLVCANSTQPLRLVAVADLCQGKHYFMFVSVNLTAAFVIFMVLILKHYWREVKIYLYARGWCLSCLSEEDMDSDRPYDAFLSFAHEDDEYVMQQLLPKLENEPFSYRICVHYRDWQVGDWIPAQIMRSIRESKRTVIILSRNFVRSWWGVLEFRHAHASTMTEDRPRLLVLILDDVLEADLSPELLGYLKHNTYLRCDDPWFWDKMQYAMPRVRKVKSLEHSQEFLGGATNSCFQDGSSLNDDVLKKNQGLVLEELDPVSGPG